MTMSKAPPFTQVSPTVRVESAPPRRREIADEKLLSNGATATHYAVGKLDAKGKPIVLGQPFDFLDWKAARVWNVYKADKKGRYQFHSSYQDEDRANVAASILANKGE